MLAISAILAIIGGVMILLPFLIVNSFEKNPKKVSRFFNIKLADFLPFAQTLGLSVGIGVFVLIVSNIILIWKAVSP